MPVNEELLRRRLEELYPTGQMNFVPPQQDVNAETPYALYSNEEVEAPAMRAIAPSEAEQRYADLLNAAPNRADYQPGKLRRLAAIFSGLSAGIQQGGGAGYQAGRAVLEEPYRQAVSDWQMRAKALEPVIELESQRGRMAQEQYRSDVQRYAADLRTMTYTQLNNERARHNTELERLEDAKLEARSREERGRIQREIDRNKTRLEVIDRQIRGSQETAKISQQGRVRAAEISADARTRAAAIAAGAARDVAKTRTAGKVTKPDLPYRKPSKAEQQSFVLDQLRQKDSRYQEFFIEPSPWYKPFGKDVVRIKSIDEIPESKKNLYRTFISEYSSGMGDTGVSAEWMDEDEDEENFQEEEEE